MIGYYQIRSPLSQVTDMHMRRYIGKLRDSLGEEFLQTVKTGMTVSVGPDGVVTVEDEEKAE